MEHRVPFLHRAFELGYGMSHALDRDAFDFLRLDEEAARQSRHGQLIEAE